MTRQDDIHSAIVEVTPPAETPVDLTEAKAHLRVTHTNEDTLITSLIGVATNTVQAFTGRQLVSATYDYKLDWWPDHVICLPRAPATGITHVKYLDPDNVEQTWNASDYQTDFDSEPGRVAPVQDESWPETRTGTFLPVRVRFACGYADADSVPDELKQACLHLIEHLYTNRELVITGTIVTKVPFTVNALIEAWKVDWFRRD